MCTLCQRLWSRKKRWVVFVRLFFLTAHTHSVRHSLLHFAVKFSGELFNTQDPHILLYLVDYRWKLKECSCSKWGSFSRQLGEQLKSTSLICNFTLLMAGWPVCSSWTWSYSWSNFRWYQDTTAESWPHGHHGLHTEKKMIKSAMAKGNFHQFSMFTYVY